MAASEVEVGAVEAMENPQEPIPEPASLGCLERLGYPGGPVEQRLMADVSSPPLQQALDKVFLHSLGLKSFLKQYQLRHT